MSIHLTALTVEKIEEIIRLAKARSNHYAGVEEANPLHIPEQHEEDLALTNLSTVIDMLPDGAKCELMALWMLGRNGDGADTSRWRDFVSASSEELTNDIATQLAMKASLHDCLTIGLMAVR